MELIPQLEAYIPADEREAEEKQVILEYARHFPDTVLLRENRIAHMTSSAFIVDEAGEMALMAHHDQRGVWAWTGGHTDGDADMLAVALREAREETGICHIRPLSEQIASLDVLYVRSHIKRGKWVNAHLHLSAAYLFVADVKDPLTVRPGENTAVGWLPIKDIDLAHFDKDDVYLYGKLAARAKALLK